MRIDRLPKFVRDFAKKMKLPLDENVESYKFTAYKRCESEDVSLINQDHFLFKLGMGLTEAEFEKVALSRSMIKYPCKELLTVEIYNVGISDGTGRELTNQIIYFAKRSNGEAELLDPYWLYQCDFKGDIVLLEEKTDGDILSAVYSEIAKVKNKVKEKREKQLEKVSSFLSKTFQTQYNDTLEKLTQYQQNNIDNKNSALINQMNAALIDIEIRKEERLSEVERQRNIIMKPPKKIGQLELVPDGMGCRVFPTDYKEIVEKYEHHNGRSNFKRFNSYALVDFYSERYNGEPRFIIVTNMKNVLYTQDYLEDLQEIIDYTYIYFIDEDMSVTEYSVKDYWMLYFRE
ncbi:MAG TPA: hypothetical protein PK733_12855 [Clostridiales bacterium]|nr:hypothetical protein [Clostridiales bacterium]